MDIATIIGVVSAFGLVLMAIGGGIGSFINAPSVLIVVGGTIGATLIAYPLKDVMGVVGVVKNAFFNKEYKESDTISMLVDFASKARKDGILALENETKDLEDLFLTRGIQLAVDGQEPEAIENILCTEIDAIKKRHKLGADVLATMGTISPAMGLIGTLIGLVQMLQNMSDPSSIGPSMAVALLTTFYGAVMANILFNPLASKLRTKSTNEMNVKELILEGVLSIVAGDNPRIVEQRLHAFLQPKRRQSAFA